ncbi:glycosyltransferase 87 family protein [Cellulomonas sp. P22]|uniref:glycosyltransferase 87 family protein n=1 Tax=Cellulomonas sp. P22 TaxID=3373189 RepID=UPI0037950F08
MHLWVVVAGTLLQAESAFNDVDLYRYWMQLGFAQGAWPTVTGGWVYPAAAALPMAIAGLVTTASAAGYLAAWLVLVAALDAVAVVALLRARTVDGTPPLVDPVRGAWWWLAFVAALGPVALGRLDAVVAPLVVMALVVAARRPRVAAALLTLGAWIKVAPGAVLLPLVLAVRRPWRDVVLPAALVCVVVVGAVAIGGGASHVLSFLGEQGSRGLQIESVGATPWVLVGLVSPAVNRYLNVELITWEISGPGTAVAVGVLGALLPVALAGAAVLLGWAHLRGHPERRWASSEEFVVRGALLVMIVLIVFNKVGSPQFIGWLAPPVAVALALGLERWRRTAWVVLALALLTQLVYPWLYHQVLRGELPGTVALVLRNALLVALLVATVRGLLAAARQPSAPDGDPAPDVAATGPAPDATDANQAGR